jgi:SepF-like predicted cell division protein (DUF552 family)
MFDRIMGREESDFGPLGYRYVKAIPLKSFDDIDIIKAEIRAGNIIISNVSQLAKKNIDDVKRGINELNEYAQLLEGDIARLGEERIILTPKNIKIWRKSSG